MIGTRTLQPILAIGILCCFCPPPVSAQETAVEILPQLYTFEKLAQTLCSDGRQVVCTPRISSRAAFIRLKPRRWTEVMSLLSEALSIKFTRLGDQNSNRWSMDPDPIVQDRDKRWIRQFTVLVRNEIRRKLEQHADLLALPHTKVWDLLGQANEKYEVVSKQQKAAEAGNDENEKVRLRKEAGRSFQELSRIREAANPFQWLMLKEMASVTAPQIEEAVRSAGFLRQSDSSALLDTLSQSSLVNTDFEEHLAALSQPGSATLFGLDFDPYRCKFQIHLALLAADGHAVHQPWFALSSYGSISDIVDGGPLSSSPYSPGLDKEARDWLASERQQTDIFLKSEPAARRFSIKTPQRVTDVSQIIEAWRSATDGEAIMELMPIRETLTRLSGDHLPRDISNGTETSLRDMFLISPGGPVNDWSLVSHNNVLIVTDRMGFLDRACPVTMDLYLAARQSLISNSPQTSETTARATPEVISQSPHYPEITYRFLKAHALTTQAVQNNRWHFLGVQGDYRGLRIREIADSLLGVIVWEKLHPILEAEETRQLSEGQNVTFPMSRLGLADRTRIVEALRNQGWTYPVMYRAEAPRLLNACEVRLRLAKPAASPASQGAAPPSLLSVAVYQRGGNPRTMTFRPLFFQLPADALKDGK